jgi:DNA-binding MarR family transcriptional regulator
MPFTEASRVSSTEPPALIGALLRVPSQVIHRQLIAGLNQAGFRELRLPHIAVFSYPGPDGSRPGDMAERAGISKQAMNQLLGSLEQLGYVEREAGGSDGRARVVRLTARGREAWEKELEVLAGIEEKWRGVLGIERFETLKGLLTEVWKSDLVP